LAGFKPGLRLFQIARKFAPAAQIFSYGNGAKKGFLNVGAGVKPDRLTILSRKSSCLDMELEKYIARDDRFSFGKGRSRGI
jgi:hypothetical protein